MASKQQSHDIFWSYKSFLQWIHQSNFIILHLSFDCFLHSNSIILLWSIDSQHWNLIGHGQPSPAEDSFQALCTSLKDVWSCESKQICLRSINAPTGDKSFDQIQPQISIFHGDLRNNAQWQVLAMNLSIWQWLKQCVSLFEFKVFFWS